MSIDTAPSIDRRQQPVEVLIEMPLSVSMAVEDVTAASETTLLDEVRMASVDGYRAAVETLTTAALHQVPAIVRADRSQRRELGAISVHTSRHDVGSDAFLFLHAHLLIDPTPVTGNVGDRVVGEALADLLPVAQADAGRAVAEQLQRAGWSMTRLPQSSPHGWELTDWADDALAQYEGGRGFSCPRIQRRGRQYYPVDAADPGARADRAAGRL